MFSFIHKQKHKNNKLLYNIKGLLRYYTPKSWCRRKFKNVLTQLKNEDKEYVLKRVDYYNKLEKATLLDNSKAVQLLNFTRKRNKKGSAYFFDTYEYTRYFPQHLRFVPLFGDITNIPKTPSITKSRPIAGNNANSVVLKLDKNRHFTFVKDNRKFTDKKNMLIGRACVKQPHRIRFWEMYFKHPMCDLGQINTKNTQHPEWIVKPISIDAHLDYKFILCIEGFDVASNLKWVMSSNSLAVMPKPTYETWFMEGTLIPNYHYVCIKDDYSDLEERLNYYINHPDEAQAIINHAHEYVAQFRNKKREDLISLLVLQKYFEKTGQLTN